MLGLLTELIKAGIELYRTEAYAEQVRQNWEGQRNIVDEARFIREQREFERARCQQLEAEVMELRQAVEQLQATRKKKR